MKKFVNLSFIGLIAFLSACQMGQSAGNDIPYPTLTPAAMPSIPAPTPSAIPPEPTSTPSRLAVSGLESYFNSSYCEPVATTLEGAQLDYINDLAVSPNGETVYFVYRRDRFLAHPEKGFNLIPNTSTPEQILPHQIIYQVNKTGQVSPLKIKGEYPQSCFLASEIEKDNQGNLILTRPVFEKSSNRTPIRGYTFYKWDLTQEQVSEIKSLDLGSPNPSPSDLPEARELKQLYVPSGPLQSLYYSLITDLYQGRDSLIQKLALDGQPENLLLVSGGGGVGAFTIFPDGQLIFGATRILPPYPAQTRDILPNGQPTSHPQWQPLNHAEVAFSMTATRLNSTGQILYISDNVRTHSLWKLDLSTGEAMLLAGSGRAGYQDGTGNQARFNQPGAIDTDMAGNLYVADVGNQAIRKITPEGVVSTLFKGDEVARRQRF